MNIIKNLFRSNPETSIDNVAKNANEIIKLVADIQKESGWHEFLKERIYLQSIVASFEEEADELKKSELGTLIYYISIARHENVGVNVSSPMLELVSSTVFYDYASVVEEYKLPDLNNVIFNVEYAAYPGGYFLAANIVDC